MLSDFFVNNPADIMELSVISYICGNIIVESDKGIQELDQKKGGQ